MIRLVTRTDVHLSDRAPASRVDDWASTVLGKLEQVGKIAADVGASAVLDNGDFFHIKSPSKNSHDLVRRVAEVHARYPCPVYANVGNHDCVYGDIRYLDSQPLGVLFSAGVFRRCYDDHEAVFEKDGLVVRVVGVPYHGTRYDMDRFARIQRKGEDYLVVMAHLLASPQGGSMFENEDIVRYGDLAAYDPDVFVFGHWHKNQGVKTVGGKVIINIGSLSRGSISQDDLHRTPACSVITFTREGVDVDVVPLVVAPPEEVFDLDRRVQEEARKVEVEQFIQTLKTMVQDPRSRSLADMVREMPDIPDPVRERCLLYIEQAT